MLTDLLRRWREVFEPPLEADPDTVLVDSQTQTFWSRSTGTSSTLVEATGGPGEVEVETVGRRVAALLAAQDAPPSPVRVEAGAGGAPAPAIGPAGCEERFVELLRSGRHEDAFALLAGPCQERWGSARAFASEQMGSAANLLGLCVREVRYLSEWVDADGGCIHRDVAELEVDYRIRLSAARAATVSRTVHLVAGGDGWRSVCYPRAVANA